MNFCHDENGLYYRVQSLFLHPDGQASKAEEGMNSLEQYKGSRHYRKIYEQIETLGLVEHINHLDENVA